MKQEATRVPPADLDAERAVLSAALLEPLTFDECQRVIGEEDFYTDSHKRIWGAIEVLKREGKAVDTTTVASWLRDQGRLDQVGGVPYLFEVVDATPSIANVVEHAKIIQRKAKLRRCISVAQTMAVEGYNPSADPVDLINDFIRQIEDIGSDEKDETQRQIRELALECQRAFYERRKSRNKVMGLPTGIQDLDEMIGGLKRKCLYYVAARPGIGKTGFLVSVCLFLAQLGYPVAIFSIEMPAQQLVDRMCAQLAQLDIKEIERGTLSKPELTAYDAAVDKLWRLPIVVDEAEQSRQSIRSASRRAQYALKKRFPETALGLIAIDYLQIMEDDPNAFSENDAITKLSKGLKALAKEFNCPVLALSQLNRDVEKEKDKRPRLLHLRGSGSIEQDGYGIMMLYREDYYRGEYEKRDGRAEILVRKHRQGGDTGTVHCQFHGPSTKFHDL